MKEKVLVIDDERATLDMFTLLLSAYGYQVLTAENGEQGVDIFRREVPKLVLTDIKMPVMDGIEALKIIKGLHPETEVIVITGHGDMDLAIQALNLDATDFINKPLKREALEKALTRATERLAISRNEEKQVVLDDRPDVAVIGVRGNVTSLTMPGLTEAYAQALDSGRKLLLIEFEKNTSINGAGITGLTELLSRDRPTDVRVVLTGLSSNFKAVLGSLGLGRLVDIVDSEEEVLSVQ